MSDKIFKYPLIPGQPVMMPRLADVLCVQTQHERPCLWALVDPSYPLEPRTFSTYGTGHDIPDDPGLYVGTFQLSGGALVFHVFEDAA